jgi:rfaE bifunctional protein nucleotidyltransferase chain/domain
MLSGTQKIFSLPELKREISSEHFHNQKIIFVHGVFDLLHRGHVTLLAEAKNLGGILVVGVESDKNTRYLKGKDRPIHSQEARLFVLAHLSPVDYVFLIPDYGNLENMDDFYSNLYRELQIDVLATCVDAGKYGPLKKSHALHAGIEFIDIPERYERNTSRVIELLKGNATK